MTTPLSNPPSFWKTVRLLLAATSKRSAGRRTRQQELLNSRSGKGATDWSALGFFFAIAFMCGLNVAAAFLVNMAVKSGQRAESESKGLIVVSHEFFEAVQLGDSYQRLKGLEILNGEDAANIHAAESDMNSVPSQLDSFYSRESRQIAEEYGGSREGIEKKLRLVVQTRGAQGFIASEDAAPGISSPLTKGPLPALLGSVVLFWWAAMLVCQGEGLELDLQRRRHPMWEWLLSHPVHPGAVFLAEMLAPIAANPIFWSAPLFPGILYGFVYGPGLGFLAVGLIGIPLMVSAACLGKALEIGITLRFPPRSRGAMLGLMGWLGYASTMLFFVGLFFIPKFIALTWKWFYFLTAVPWPWLRLFLGAKSDGSFSFLSGLLACWFVSVFTTGGAIWFSVWGAQQGLSGNYGKADSRPVAKGHHATRFGKEPLYRKEFLWFTRDRSAIVQTILVPITVAGFQLFNLRAILAHAQDAWNYLCGAGILFGTYFLLVLGPKSLASEGQALWIALTWPRGLESLLKAKAWLWSLISTGAVGLIFVGAAFLFPADIWKILLVGIGWFFFSRTMAEKSVTLVTITSSSGETQKIPWGRRAATQLGMLTFSVGIMTQQWHIAIMGIVYSWITAAAIWQNFRARLPYLYDPWSEKLPPPPTLMHAMIAISLLVEGGAVITALLMLAVGKENAAVAMAMSYGISSVILAFGTASFLESRGVANRDVWNWRPAAPVAEGSEPQQLSLSARARALGSKLPLGVAGGLALGLVGFGYMSILRMIPATAEIIRKSHEQFNQVPGLYGAYFVMAVCFAPFAEEYLFRGLLFRALDREWGGMRAVVASAAFFAIYHPPLAWPPVFLLGAANCLLFKKTGSLIPCIALHMVYNCVVLSM